MTASMSFYADADTTVRLSEYGTNRAPILTLDGEDHSLSVSAFDRVPIADHLTFARDLAAACADYVKALEAYAAALADDGDQEPDEGR
ncbi:hypothetical protein ABTY96_12265 [Streptomyces sp. NPDC096057]|uniref:hypothetical protein n=1 Tax=Streptomyces sp. NPDC096057 TaxID=3155543 RepID=UPI00332E8667